MGTLVQFWAISLRQWLQPYQRQNKLAGLKATFGQKSAQRPLTEQLTGVQCRADSIANENTKLNYTGENNIDWIILHTHSCILCVLCELRLHIDLRGKAWYPNSKAVPSHDPILPWQQTPFQSLFDLLERIHFLEPDFYWICCTFTQPAFWNQFKQGYSNKAIPWYWS